MGSQAAWRKAYVDPNEAAVLAEMDRLHGLGFHLIPLGRDEENKTPAVEDATDVAANDPDRDKRPAVKFRNRRRLPLKVVWDVMYRNRSLMYGILLPGLLVVDLDTDTPKARAYLSKRFGTSTVIVATRRGRHLWFRTDEKKGPTRVREDGIAIDFKTGPNSFVVGPKSVRPDGTVYQYELGEIDRRKTLPLFVDRRPAARPDGKGAVGDRHYLLLSKAIEFAWDCTSEDDLHEELLAQRDWECDEPETLPDEEVRGIAAWAWRKRLANDLWGGRNSVVKLRRTVQDTLLQHPYGAEALALYVVLESNHGHRPGYTFAIVARAMREAGLINLSDKKIWRARDLLLEEGLLVRARRRPGFSMADQFQLARPTGARRTAPVPAPALAAAANL